jgi:hypothetical protein
MGIPSTGSTAARAVPPPLPPYLRALIGGCLVLLLGLLPALVAGRNLDAAAAPGELRRALSGLAAASHDPDYSGSRVARLFYGAAILENPAAVPADAEAQASLLAQARVGQVVGVLGMALLVYLTTMLALGRSRALVATGALVLVPAVHAEGHVLRPETPAVLFGMLALLLMQLVPDVQRTARRRGPLRRRLVLVSLCGVAAAAAGLAPAALPAAGIYLLVSGAVMIAVGVQLCLRQLRAMARRRFEILPIRAVAARLWPWTLIALLSLLAATLLMGLSLEVDAGALRATASASPLLPANGFARWPLAAVAGIGALSLVLRVGLRFGRRGRPAADFVLVVFCAVLLLQRVLQTTGTDALPAAGPLGVLLAEGVFALPVLLGVLARRRTLR